MRNRNYKYDNNKKDKSLSGGIAAFISSFLFGGSSALIYFLKVHNNSLVIFEAIFLWMFIIVFFLCAIYLLIWGTMVIIYNIILIKKKLPREKGGDAVWINTNPIAGFIALAVSIMFTLTVILFLYPKYKAGEVDLMHLLTFIIFATLFCIIYSKESNFSIIRI